jgi:hypothetical protein
MKSLGHIIVWSLLGKDRDFIDVELLCHHIYKLDGRPVNLSVYNSYGQLPVDMEFLKDGVA